MSNSQSHNSTSYSSTVQEDLVAPPGWGKRHFTTIMLFFGMANAYVMRTNMSVAIVAITEERQWTPLYKGFILSSFFYGYVLLQIPIGFLSNRYNTQRILAVGMIVNSLASFLVPISAKYFWSLFIIRLIQGIGEGPIVPCTHAILAKWIPPGERSFLGGFVYSGAQFGTVFSYLLSGLFAYDKFFGGWPLIFYFFGTICLIWSILFYIFVYENPAIDKTISAIERDYILKRIFGGDIIEGLKESKVPWHDIVKSIPFWSIMIAHAGQNFGYETLMTMLPSFLYSTLHFNLKDCGVVSALPYIVMFFTSLTLNYTADVFIRQKTFRTVTVRKIMNSIGQFGPSIMFVTLCLVGFNKFSTIVCLMLAMGMNGGIYSGFKVNHIDISPCFAGILMSLTNCTANVIGMTAPAVAGFLLNNFHNDQVLSWKIVFYTAAFQYGLCATIFLLFASGSKQTWDRRTAKAIISRT